jgi:hypothetical protein
LAKIQIKLPPYCVKKKRKDGHQIYFQVPARCRPENWPATIKVGHTAHDSIKEIVSSGEKIYQEFINFKSGIIEVVHKGSLNHVIETYKTTDYWQNLKPATKKSYEYLIRIIDEWSRLAGYPHIKIYKVKHLHAFLNKWKEKPKMRREYKNILNILFKIAINEDLIKTNIVKEISFAKTNKVKTIRVWEQEDINKFVDKADKENMPNLGTAALIAYETGQRMTDIFSFQEPRDYKDGCFIFKTSKTSKRIYLPATQKLKTRLEQKEKSQLLLTVRDNNKRTWDKFFFNKKFRYICSLVGLDGYQFRQIRNSAAMIAERAELTDAEFESIFGWPRDHVRKMMREYYGDRDPEVAKRGIAKIEEYKNKLDA